MTSQGSGPSRPASATRIALTYLVTVAVPVLAVVALVAARGGPGRDGASPPAGPAAQGVLFHLLLAAAVIVAAAAVGGRLARLVGQPAVVGELLAGLLLGPSVLGAAAPGAQAWLFPGSIAPLLDALAQLGVVLFMFLVGAELSLSALRGSGPRGLVIGHAAIALPLLCGVALGLALPARYRPPDVGVMAFAVFVGVCVAITAFPVLARILDEEGLLRTPLGATGMTAAGVGDVTAWCLLAVVVAGIRGTSMAAAASAVLLVAAFTLVMLMVVRPLLSSTIRRVQRVGAQRGVLFAALLSLVLMAAVSTEKMGVHAIFGAFLAGVILPRDSPVTAELATKLEGAVLWLLMPIFFVTVALRVDLATLDIGGQWPICLVIVLIAMGSKIAGTALASAATGGSRRESLALGLMMNCRGLTELIVLGIGLQLGVLNEDLFAMLLVMALGTTAMTGPLLRRVIGPHTPAGRQERLALVGTRQDR